MKIIDNKKDYYDYLSGVYGIDNLVVYDRRGSSVLSSSLEMAYYFRQTALPWDHTLSNKHYWELKSLGKRYYAKKMKHKYRKTWKEGDVYHFILEVGRIHYRFEVERWLDEGNLGNIHVTYTLLDTIKDVQERYSDAPMCIIPCRVDSWQWSEDQKWKELANSMANRVTNPILDGTFITKVIPPTDIWDALYEYISSLRDKPITDSRSDVQKLESAGFDRKTSFRKAK
ncbi:MAG: hypothetical protein IK008_02445 [Bacteroidales bacterium]|nr:hypothetical protein [Bacteroidales bacterium]